MPQMRKGFRLAFALALLAGAFYLYR